MTNLPTTARQSTGHLRPAPMSREDDTRLRALLSRLERTLDGRWQLPDTAPVTADDRRWLTARRETLERSMIRCAERVVASLVLALFLRFPSAANAADQEARDRLYVSELRQFPQWALEAVMTRVKGSFAPSLPDLVALVRGELVAVHAEISSLSRVLSADTYHVPDEAERERVEAAYRDLLEKLEWNMDDMRPAKKRLPTRQEAILAVENMRAEPMTLPPLSDRLRAHLGLGGAAE